MPSSIIAERCYASTAARPSPAQSRARRIIPKSGSRFSDQMMRKTNELFFASMKSISFGDKLSGFQSRPPSKRSGRSHVAEATSERVGAPLGNWFLIRPSGVGTARPSSTRCWLHKPAPRSAAPNYLTAPCSTSTLRCECRSQHSPPRRGCDKKRGGLMP